MKEWHCQRNLQNSLCSLCFRKQAHADSAWRRAPPTATWQCNARPPPHRTDPQGLARGPPRVGDPARQRRRDSIRPSRLRRTRPNKKFKAATRSSGGIKSRHTSAIFPTHAKIFHCADRKFPIRYTAAEHWFLHNIESAEYISSQQIRSKQKLWPRKRIN